MNFPVLPFCRSIIKDFYFKIFTEPCDLSNCIVFKCNGYRVKVLHKRDGKDFLIFGKYKDKYCIIEQSDEIDDNYHHVMGKNFTEELRTIAGIGISTYHWSNDNRFCGKCGSILKFSDKEHNAKFCEKCNNTIFPRLNPAIIIAVKKEDSILVTRKSEWKGKRYGLVAGFIEYGENIEEAASREVFEETNIKIRNIKYVASQFWPFPYQLMIGLEAEYDSGKIILDEEELAEAKWLKFKYISEDILPPQSSIARFLMERFKI